MDIWGRSMEEIHDLVEIIIQLKIENDFQAV